jgi:hypothetical protein
MSSTIPMAEVYGVVLHVTPGRFRNHRAFGDRARLDCDSRMEKSGLSRTGVCLIGHYELPSAGHPAGKSGPRSYTVNPSVSVSPPCGLARQSCVPSWLVSVVRPARRFVGPAGVA